MTSAIIKQWIFGFLQAETSAFIGLGCAGGDAKLLCPTAPTALGGCSHPVFSWPRWAGAGPHSPREGSLPPQCGGMHCSSHPTASPAVSWCVASSPALCSHRLLAARASLTNTSSLTDRLCAHRCRRHQRSSCIRPTFAAFSLPQLGFI